MHPGTSTAPHPGQALRALRTRKQLTTPQLGALAGIHPVTILRIERGDNIPQADTLAVLLVALGASDADSLRVVRAYGGGR